MTTVCRWPEIQQLDNYYIVESADDRDKLMGIDHCKAEIARIKKHMKRAQESRTSMAVLKYVILNSLVY